MSILEGAISLLVLMMLILAVQANPPHAETKYDDYRLALAQDAWRTMYLHGDFSGPGGLDRANVQADLDRISWLTGMCVSLEEEDLAGCREGVEIVRIRKYAVVDGVPKELTLVLRK
ncbi:MAG: hypothetical protein ACP5NX_03390 [Candidatus Bilamarchaeaceae archaeon]